jgi:Uma2 family endonuclease
METGVATAVEGGEALMALAPTRQPYRFTVEEYLAFERAAEFRHEWCDGVVYPHADSSLAHSTIHVNLLVSLGSQLRGTPCEVFSVDMKVRCGPGAGDARQGLFAYPDLVVVCGAMQFHDVAQDVVLNPRVLIEVLSPSTEAFDRGDKFHRYRTWLPTLADYVLVAQHQPVIEHYHRGLDDLWTLRTLEGLTAVLHLEQIGCTVALADVYERVTLAASEETA